MTRWILGMTALACIALGGCTDNESIDQTASSQRLFQEAVFGLEFTETSSGTYYHVKRGNQALEYPASDLPTDSKLLTLRLLPEDATVRTEYAVLTVVDPHGEFQFRMALPFSETHEVVLFTSVAGSYLLHVTGDGFEEKYIRFHVSKNKNATNLGDIPLKREQ